MLTFYPGLSIDGSGPELEDERWAIRVWRADEWLDTLRRKFSVLDIRRARPALWASVDPAGEHGNENLTRFVRDGRGPSGEGQAPGKLDSRSQAAIKVKASTARPKQARTAADRQLR